MTTTLFLIFATASDFSARSTSKNDNQVFFEFLFHQIDENTFKVIHFNYLASSNLSVPTNFSLHIKQLLDQYSSTTNRFVICPAPFLNQSLDIRTIEKLLKTSEAAAKAQVLLPTILKNLLPKNYSKGDKVKFEEVDFPELIVKQSVDAAANILQNYKRLRPEYLTQKQTQENLEKKLFSIYFKVDMAKPENRIILEKKGVSIMLKNTEHKQKKNALDANSISKELELAAQPGRTGRKPLKLLWHHINKGKKLKEVVGPSLLPDENFFYKFKEELQQYFSIGLDLELLKQSMPFVGQYAEMKGTSPRRQNVYKRLKFLAIIFILKNLGARLNDVAYFTRNQFLSLMNDSEFRFKNNKTAQMQIIPMSPKNQQELKMFEPFLPILFSKMESTQDMLRLLKNFKREVEGPNARLKINQFSQYLVEQKLPVNFNGQELKLISMTSFQQLEDFVKENVEPTLLGYQTATSNLRFFNTNLVPEKKNTPELELRRNKSNITSHGLRARLLTNIYSNTLDLKLTQQIAGHSKIETTARYIRNNELLQVNKEALNRAAEGIIQKPTLSETRDSDENPSVNEANT